MGLAHETTEKGVLVIGVEGRERGRQLLRTILVGALQLLTQAAKEPSDSAILGERVEGTKELRRALRSLRARSWLSRIFTTPSLSVGLSFLNSGLDSPI